ncbi:MAG: hypothetical protein H6Q74_1722 [Firmicutes bacterium]|nr:hypothetical protein [Bacillota bacterium]
MIQVISANKVYLDYGPMQMTLIAYAEDKGQSLIDKLQGAARYGISLLEELSLVLPVAKSFPTANNTDIRRLPLPLVYMVEAVRATKDLSLTPMAAVAGTFADLVANWLVERGAAKVIINNGGDIAIRLWGEEMTKIGITPSIGATQLTHLIELSSRRGIGGVATSGLGGRSFTKGIASSVTVFGQTARIADSCATLIANHCYFPDPGIRQLPADELDPNTDIPGHLVTVEVKNISMTTKLRALERGIAKATELRNAGIIHGAIVFIDELVMMIPENVCCGVNK